MSAYGKEPPQLHGYDGNRPFAEPSFAFTPAPYVSQPSGTANPTAYYNAPQMPSLGPLGYGNRSEQFDDQEGAYLNVGSTSIPEVLSYQPASGGEGTRFEVSISALYEMATTVPMCSIMFSTRKCGATVTKTQQQGAVCQYLVATEVPPYQATGWNSSTLPVYLLVENGEGDLLSKIDVGSFSYDEGRPQTTESQRIPHDRKVSRESMGVKEGSSLRLSNDELSKGDLPQYGGYTTSENVAQSSYLQPGNSYGGMMTQYSRQPQYTSQAPQRPLYYPNSSTSSSPSVKVRSPLVPGWTPYPSASTRGTAANRIARNPGQKNMSSNRPSLTPMPSPMVANPPLIRTSTLQQSHQTPSPAHTPAGASQAGHSYSYSPYAPKASLKIMGNLDSMAHEWNYEEWETKRRLVLFERTQNGSEITTTFKAVSADERPHNSICISCIFWPEKQDMFVTSVDTISLLERLVNARFTVEEKNRIRRNLEGFRPLTVSKGKADTEEMFKIIMLFPNPKPRNIEKDVKVFPWKILSSALKKIIGKYSASPSSTLPPAPALLTPVSQTGYTTDGSSVIAHTKNEHAGLVSPSSGSRSVSGASASTVYVAGGPSRTISPPTSKQSIHLHGGGGPPDLRLSVPSYSSHVAQSHQWPPPNQHMAGYTQPSSHLGDQSLRNSWDLNSYLQTSPANATPNSAQSQSQSLLHTNSQRLSGHEQSQGGEEGKQRATSQSQQMPPS